MIFSKHILAAAFILLLGTACNTTPVSDETLSANTADCILPEMEDLEKPLTGAGKTNKGEEKPPETAGCSFLEQEEKK